MAHCPLLFGFQRSTGLRAAAVSSSRDTRVECGASSTVWGSSSTSSAIDFIASMNRSISSLDSLSVGALMIEPTERESKAEMGLISGAMKSLVEEVEGDTHNG